MDGNASYGSAPVGTGNAKASQLISKQGADRTPWAPSAALGFSWDEVGAAGYGAADRQTEPLSD